MWIGIWLVFIQIHSWCVSGFVTLLTVLEVCSGLRKVWCHESWTFRARIRTLCDMYKTSMQKERNYTLLYCKHTPRAFRPKEETKELRALKLRKLKTQTKLLQGKMEYYLKYSKILYPSIIVLSLSCVVLCKHSCVTAFSLGLIYLEVGVVSLGKMVCQGTDWAGTPVWDELAP